MDSEKCIVEEKEEAGEEMKWIRKNILLRRRRENKLEKMHSGGGEGKWIKKNV